MEGSVPGVELDDGDSFDVFAHGAQVEALRYMHRNPVKAGLVIEPEDWPWSSYRNYASGEVGRVGVDSGWAREEARWKPSVP